VVRLTACGQIDQPAHGSIAIDVARFGQADLLAITGSALVAEVLQVTGLPGCAPPVRPCTWL